MKKEKVYSWLSAAAGFVGVGMIFGYSLSEGTSNVPLWIGGILILLGAVMLGMVISLNSSAQAGDTTLKETKVDV